MENEVPESRLYEAAIKVAKELAKLRKRMIKASNDPVEEPGPKDVAEVCRRFATGFKFELLERESYLGIIVKLTDDQSGQYCLIAPDEPPTQVEEPGQKNYKFHLELNIRHTLEVEADDMLDAQEQVFEMVEELVVGDCDEVSVGFLEDEETFGPGFSLN